MFEKYRHIIPDFESFLKAVETPQPYWFRVNTIKIGEKELVSRLSDKGFVLERFRDLNAYKIVSMPVKHPGATLEHSFGYYYVQDISSMVPALVLDPKPGELVLDMAAAPGSKTTLMAALMKNEGSIVANDTRASRLRALGSNVERLGVTNVMITKGDARTMDFKHLYDKILLDAPCSGEGVIRKNPKHGIPGDKEHRYFSQLQKSLIKNAWKHLDTGSKLVYSTCTFNPIENEDVVQYAVSKLGMEILQVEFPVPHVRGVSFWEGRDYSDISDYVMRIYPHLLNTGGMFIAVLEKR